MDTLRAPLGRLDPLVDAEPYVLFGFIELAGLLLGLHLADDLLEELDGIEATAAFEAFDVNFNRAVGADRNIEFSLWHG